MATKLGIKKIKINKVKIKSSHSILRLCEVMLHVMVKLQFDAAIRQEP